MTDDHWVFTAPQDLPFALVPLPLSFLSCGEMDSKSCHSDSPETQAFVNASLSHADFEPLFYDNAITPKSTFR